MPAPFIYVSSWVVDGPIDKYEQFAREHAEFVEANEPRLISFNLYLDRESSTVTVVQVHPDSDSMDFHMKLMAESITSALDVHLGPSLTTIVCGEGKETIDTIVSFDPDRPLTVAEEHIAGFTRTLVA